ncbi:MAG: hypothetical protein H6643_01790 [Caldilineaceae bacterium]|nr:hypothetical protein [Caldilineaceae bacterium]
MLFACSPAHDWDAFSDLDLAAILHRDAETMSPQKLPPSPFTTRARPSVFFFTQVVGSDGYIVLRGFRGIAISFHRLDAVDPGTLTACVPSVANCPPARSCSRWRGQLHGDPLAAESDELHRFLAGAGCRYRCNGASSGNALPRLDRMRGPWSRSCGHARRPARLPILLAEASCAAVGLSRTLPHFDAGDLNAALRAQSAALQQLLRILEHDLAELSNGQLALGAEEAELLQRLRARQQALLQDM